ncbi:MAG: ABC transporter ATP-binding protein [Spirochaetaceae bacterium]|nr:MAG: ABC transporter ATP-binding protein [Spirochaetaceae bacterium]
MREDYLVLKNLVKEFGGAKEAVVAVDHVSLQVREGELVTLLGPSGCGKTTTLRMIAGFEFPTSGDIYLEGERINDMPPNRRPTTMVFQNYALFPHMSVAQNIEYGLKIHRIPGREIRERVEEVMRLVGLAKMGGRSPAQLSGGQQQRVSLARSLIMEPKVLLLDEPLSNLDAKLRESTRIEIRKLQRRLGITSVYVTHDQEEAMTLSDRVVIMHEGKIQQIGTPSDIYAHPANRFVADFIGKANFLEAQVVGISSANTAEVEIQGVNLQIPIGTRKLAKGAKVVLVIRPESVAIEPKKPGALIGTIRESVYLGSEIVYEVQLQDKLITVKVPNPREHTLFSTDQEVSVHIKEKSLHILPAEEHSL